MTHAGPISEIRERRWWRNLVKVIVQNSSERKTAERLAPSSDPGSQCACFRASAGEARVFDALMRPASKALRQRIGYLSDAPVFPRDLTAIGYLEFVGQCFGLARKDRKARIGTLLRAVGLMDDAGRKVGSYSTGMRTRLGIAASLMNDPELLVWDEPTAGLDPISRRQTLELLEQFRGN
jgi:ABC-2 type transport system ATP-binding protein